MATPELLHHIAIPDYLIYLASLPPLLAFSVKVRKEIGQRDSWTCQTYRGECLTGILANGGHPVAYREGFMVTASHYDTEHGKDHKSAGRILCVLDHAREELDRGNEWGAEQLLRMGIYHREGANRKGGNIYFTIDDLR